MEKSSQALSLVHFQWEQLSCTLSLRTALTLSAAQLGELTLKGQLALTRGSLRKGNGHAPSLLTGGIIHMRMMLHVLRAVVCWRAPWKQRSSSYVSLAFSQVLRGGIWRLLNCIVTRGELVQNPRMVVSSESGPSRMQDWSDACRREGKAVAWIPPATTVPPWAVEGGFSSTVSFSPGDVYIVWEGGSDLGGSKWFRREEVI